MKRFISTLSLLFAILSLACSPGQSPPEESEKTPSKKVKKAPRLEGEIHAARVRQRVRPFIMHQPSMDLRVQCLSYRDQLAEQNKSVPLCFAENERDVATLVTTLRVEEREGLRMAQALALLRPDHEAAHFVVDDGGVPYQLLDLALPARRNKLYPNHEIRVLSGSAKGSERLTAALKELYPKLKVTRVELEHLPTGKAKASAPKPKASAPKAHSPQEEHHSPQQGHH